MSGFNRAIRYIHQETNKPQTFKPTLVQKLASCAFYSLVWVTETGRY